MPIYHILILEEINTNDSRYAKHNFAYPREKHLIVGDFSVSFSVNLVNHVYFLTNGIFFMPILQLKLLKYLKKS